MEHDYNYSSAAPERRYDASIDATHLGANPSSLSGLKQFRMSKRESQEKFWGRFGVTQSSGSRFETGLGIPPPVAILVKLYLKGKLNDGDLLG